MKILLAALAVTLPLPVPSFGADMRVIPLSPLSHVAVQATPRPRPRPDELHVPCWVVRSYVWAHGEAAVIEWAVRNGYSPAQIDSIRARCVAR